MLDTVLIAGNGVGRSVRLFRSFLTEQSDPVAFYELIAEDTLAMLRRHVDPAGLLVADFGGGAGFYSDAFRRAGATTVLIDADPGEITLHGRRPPNAVAALAEQAPLPDACVDIAFSSNLLEHVRDLGAVADQITRVVKPGGLVVLSYTMWWGPWGGHETSPWHLVGGHFARRRYERRLGKRPKNVYGESMFPATVGDGLRWVRSRPDLEILELRPRYLPGWTSWLLRVPVLRELLTWNLWIVARRRVDY